MARKVQKPKVRGDKPSNGENGGANDEMRDRDVDFRRYFDAKQSQFLRTLVCDDVIEEHRRKPLGQHSESLERLLLHFRRMPMAEKFAVRRDSATSRFTIVALSGERGTPPRPVEGPDYATVEDAYHGIFLLQIKELMGT